MAVVACAKFIGILWPGTEILLNDYYMGNENEKSRVRCVRGPRENASIANFDQALSS